MAFFKKNKEKEQRSKQNLFSIILLVFLTLYAVSLLGVLLWGFMSAFKGILDFEDRAYQFPKHFENNFKVVFEKFVLKDRALPSGVQRDVTLPMMFEYSFLYAFGSAITATVIPCITAYACARFPFKFSKVIYTVVIVTMIIPTVGNLPSELQLTINLGIYNQIYGLWIMKANFLGMYFLVFYNVFKSFPSALTEAAKIDGAGNLKIMLRIAFPVVANVFATVLLINFVNFWNDYQTPLLYMPAFPTLAYGLNYYMRFGQGKMQFTPPKLAAAILIIIPILILFVAFQNRLLGNLTVGGVKG